MKNKLFSSKALRWGSILVVCLILLLPVVVFARSESVKQHYSFQKVDQKVVRSQEIAYVSQSSLQLTTQSDNTSSQTVVYESSSNSSIIAQDYSVTSSESTSSQSTYLPPQPTSCPVSTQNCLPCHVSETYCRVLPGEEYGYLGWACQNNNPGNIRYSDYRIGYITAMGGEAPCADRGGFMAFSTYAAGYNSVKVYHRAIDAGLHPAYQGDGYNCGAGTCSLYQFFTHYAPNNPINYTNNLVAKMSGNITGETNYRWVIQNRHDDFMAAMMQMEGFFTQ